MSVAHTRRQMWAFGSLNTPPAYPKDIRTKRDSRPRESPFLGDLVAGRRIEGKEEQCSRPAALCLLGVLRALRPLPGDGGGTGPDCQMTSG